MSRCPHCHQVIDCTGLTGILECPHCRKRFNCTPTRTMPTVAAQLPEAVLAQPEEPQFVFDAPVSPTRSFLNKKKNPKTLWDFIDLGFHHYLTPIIIKVIWALCLGLAALSLVGAGFSVVTSLLPESDHSQPSPTGWNSPSSFGSTGPTSAFEQKTTMLVLRILGWLALAVVTAIGLLVVRVVCESIIVLFNIAESLVSIDKKTQAV